MILNKKEADAELTRNKLITQQQIFTSVIESEGNSFLAIQEDVRLWWLILTIFLQAPLNLSDDASSAPLNLSDDASSAPLNLSDDASSAPLNLSDDASSAPLNLSDDASSTPLNLSYDASSTPLNLRLDQTGLNKEEMLAYVWMHFLAWNTRGPSRLIFPKPSQIDCIASQVKKNVYKNILYKNILYKKNVFHLLFNIQKIL